MRAKQDQFIILEKYFSIAPGLERSHPSLTIHFVSIAEANIRLAQAKRKTEANLIDGGIKVSLPPFDHSMLPISVNESYFLSMRHPSVNWVVLV